MAVENLGGCALSKHAAPRVEERRRRVLGERRGRTDAMPALFTASEREFGAVRCILNSSVRAA